MVSKFLQTLIYLHFILIQSRRRCTPDPRKQLKKRNANIPIEASHKRKEVPVAYNPATNASSLLPCKLPLEIRRQIYVYALGQQVIHLLSPPESRISAAPVPLLRTLPVSAALMVVHHSFPITFLSRHPESPLPCYGPVYKFTQKRSPFCTDRTPSTSMTSALSSSSRQLFLRKA